MYERHRDTAEAMEAPQGRGEGPLPRAAAQPRAARRRLGRIPLVIGAGVAAILLLGGLMVWRAASRTNHVALSSAPLPVTTVPARAASYRASRAYIGTIRPWVEANVGPQFISAYVDTVLVRPGAVVKRGEVLATLDCRNANTATQAVAAQARAIEARQKALADEAARTQQLLKGGFVSENEAEQKLAHSAAEAASLAAERANLAKSSLSVSDCVLRSPFDGEVAERYADPGAFVRPGAAIVTVVDRSTVRMVADAPESDFGAVAPGTPARVHVMPTDAELAATITRRAPAADPGTRTVHFEIDVPDPRRQIPVNTTMEVKVDVGTPVAATSVPVFTATTSADKATLSVVEDGVAHTRTLHPLGEVAGRLFFSPQELAAGTQVVSEGRALVANGTRVAAREAPNTASGADATVVADPSRGGAK